MAITYDKFGNKEKSHGPNLDNVVDRTAAPILIFTIWSLGRRRWNQGRCHSWKVLIVCPFIGRGCRSFLVNPRKQWKSPFRPIRLSALSSELVLQVESAVSIVPCCLAYQCIHNSSTVSKRCRNLKLVNLIFDDRHWMWRVTACSIQALFILWAIPFQ